MAKYTDEQIKKALECCSAPTTTSKLSCNSCPILGTRNCMALTNRYALDLINRQEAEKAELQLEITNCNSKIEKLKEKNRLANQCTPKAIRRARAEAIKEFWEDLKKQSFQGCDCAIPDDVVFVEDGDNLVAEIVGESK